MTRNSELFKFYKSKTSSSVRGRANIIRKFEEITDLSSCLEEGVHTGRENRFQFGYDVQTILQEQRVVQIALRTLYVVHAHRFNRQCQ